MTGLFVPAVLLANAPVAAVVINVTLSPARTVAIFAFVRIKLAAVVAS